VESWYKEQVERTQNNCFSLLHFELSARDSLYLLIVTAHDGACCAHGWTRNLRSISEAFLIEYENKYQKKKKSE
jgi:hypothetical protein